MTEHHEEGEEYAGAAVLTVDERDLDVRVHLKGHLEPIDGRFHWYGRIAPTSGLDPAQHSGATARLCTPHGEVEGRLSDADPWGRLRIAGLGRPPF